MQPASFIWLNNRFVPWNEARIHFLSHALHYGTGVFEGIRCYDGKPFPNIFRLNAHIKRLENSAKIMGFSLPFSAEQISQAIIETVQKNGLRQCYIRPLVFLGYGEMGLNPIPCPVEMGIAAWNWEHYLGADAFEKGIHVKISTWVRNSPDALPPTAKITGAYANSALAKREAVEEGFEDAILLDDQGFVAEGTGENIFMVRDNRLVTPPLNNCLEGITRKSILEIAEDLKIKTHQKHLTRGELYTADECFFSGTAAELTPITQIDHRVIGNGAVGPVAQKIQEQYSSIVHGKNAKFKRWLTPVK